MSESERGPVRMIDVGGKASTVRRALASGRIRMAPDVLERVRKGTLEKGDALQTARIAAILAAKRTPEIVPLCHPIRISSVKIDFDFASETELRIEVSVGGDDRTGVEMEALTAVSAAALTVYDLCKMYGQGMEIGPIRLEEKTGGKTGDYHRKDAASDSP